MHCNFQVTFSHVKFELYVKFKSYIEIKIFYLNLNPTSKSKPLSDSKS